MIVEQALALDVKNDNTLWADTIFEMENVRVAFEVLPDEKSVLIGHKFVWCHMVFDVKIKDFRQKARIVAAATITYASVVSRDTVSIALMIATLNNLEVKCVDILNAYVQAPVAKKVWTIMDAEFGKDAERLH